MNDRYIAAIDVGGSKVVVAVAELTQSDEVRMVSAQSEPMDGESVRSGEVRNVINLKNSIAKCIRNIEQEDGYRIRKAVVSLSGSHIKCVDFEYTISVRNKNRQVSQVDIDELYQQAVNKHNYEDFFIVDIIPQSYYVDGLKVGSPLGTIGKKIRGEFCIVVCNRLSKEVFDRVFEELNVDVINYTISSIASAEAVLLDDEKEYGVVLVDIGSDCSDIIVYKNNVACDIGVVPLGGRNINNDIASLNIMPRYVEGLKINYARALASNSPYYDVVELPIKSDNINKRIVKRELCSVVEARVRDIAEEINRFLEEGGCAKGLGAGVVLTGGTAKLPDIVDVFKEILGYPNVTVRNPSLDEKDPFSEILRDTEYSTIIGLLKNAFYNLPQEEFRGGVTHNIPVELDVKDIQEPKGVGKLESALVPEDTEQSGEYLKEQDSSFLDDDYIKEEEYIGEDGYVEDIDDSISEPKSDVRVKSDRGWLWNKLKTEPKDTVSEFEGRN